MGLRIGLLALILLLYYYFFLSFKALFVSQFSPELCKIESSNRMSLHRGIEIHTWRMSCCIVG